MRALMALGLLAAFFAVFVGLREAPPRSAVAPSASGAPVASGWTSLGPLVVGATVDGFRVELIERAGEDVRVVLTRPGARCVVGLGAPGPARPTPLVQFPDVYVWYATDGGATTPPNTLLVGLVAALRAGAQGDALHRKLAEWAAR